MHETYREGGIVSLHLKNFQTYQAADFYFHPQLNFIAGPNGSGKSSIANAIAFVFCGSPGTIGKTKEIGEYVNFGATEASVVAVVRHQGRSCTLKRVFSKVSKKSVWYIDGAHKRQSEYVLFVEGLSINVDNLCQFLPQEKVSEFASLAPDELLTYTLSSQGDGTTMKLRRELSALERGRDELERTIGSAKRKRDGIERIVRTLEKGVEKIRERGKKEERIMLMKAKRKWLIYELLKREFKRARDEASVFSREVASKEELVRRCDEKISALKNSEEIRRLDQEKAKILGLNGELEDSLASVKRQSEQIDLLEVDKKSLAKKRELRVQEIGNLEKGMESAAKKLENFTVEEVGTCSIDSKEIDRLEEQVFDYKMERSRIAGDSQRVQESIDELQRRRQEFSKEEHRRLEFLKRYHADTYSGVLWLRANRGMFREEVIEPAVLSVQLRNPKFLEEQRRF